MSGLYRIIALGPDKRPSTGTVIAESPVLEEIEHLWVPGEQIVAWVDTTPPRRLSQASLDKRRRTRLKTKLRETVPLFAAELEQRELTARPAFYAGVRASEGKETGRR